MRTNFVRFVLLAAVAANPSVAQPIIEAVPDRPQIPIVGHGEAKNAPDVATIAYTIRGEGPTTDAAVRKMAAAAAQIDSAVAAIDPAAEPHTSEVKIVAVRSDDCKERSYGAPQLSVGACAISGYVATQSATVHTGAVKQAGTMVGVIGRAGGLDPRISAFALRDSRPAQQQAMEAALADAASKAAAIAAASHVRLGAILHVASGRRNDSRQIIVSGSRIPAPAPPPPPPPPVRVNVAPEPITTTSYLTVTYLIGQ